MNVDFLAESELNTNNKINLSISSDAQKNDVSTCIILAGAHRSARRLRLKSRRLLQLNTN